MDESRRKDINRQLDIAEEAIEDAIEAVQELREEFETMKPQILEARGETVRGIFHRVEELYARPAVGSSAL